MNKKNLVYKNEYLESELYEHGQVIGKVDSYVDKHIKIKTRNNKEVVANIEENVKLEKNKNYNFYIYKTNWVYYVNGIENIKEMKKGEVKGPFELEVEKVLNELNLDFEYEKTLAIKDENEYERLWYPDFYLKDLNIFIEVYCKDGDNEHRADFKNRTYEKNKIDVIKLYREHFNFDKNFLNVSLKNKKDIITEIVLLWEKREKKIKKIILENIN